MHYIPLVTSLMLPQHTADRRVMAFMAKQTRMREASLRNFKGAVLGRMTAHAKIKERYDPAEGDEQSRIWHVGRYKFAQAYATGGTVLDIACGNGYGTDLLREAGASHTVGVDISLESVRRARHSSPSTAISYLLMDGRSLGLENEVFDLVVSFETIEHIHEFDKFLFELHRVLRPAAKCIISTPNKAYWQDRTQKNPFHVVEFGERELRDALAPYFDSVTLFGQALSSVGRDTMRSWKTNIRDAMNDQMWVVRTMMRVLYYPNRHFIPDIVKGFCVRRLLRVQTSKPDLSHLEISTESVGGSQVLIAVCEKGGR